MPDHVLVLATEMSRAELRDLGLRVYGDPQHGGHFVSRRALLERLAGTERIVASTEAVLAPEPGGVYYRVAHLMYRDGSPSIAGSGPGGAKIVTWGTNHGDAIERGWRDKFAAMLQQILIPVVNRNVIVTVPHCRQARLNEDPNKFVIHFWSSPYSGGEDRFQNDDEWGAYEPPEELWGVEMETPDEMGLPLWEEGTAIVAPDCDEDHPIGAFNEGNLYLYADLCHRSSEGELEILKHILEAVAILYKGGKLPAVEPSTLRSEYVKMVAKRKEAQTKEYKDKLDEVKRGIESNNSRIVELMRQERQLLKDMVLLDSDEAYNTERFAAEYDRLMTNPLIKSIKMSRGGMTVFTNMLNVTDPRTNVEHEIGEMSIYIDIGRYNVVTKNLTRKVNGLQNAMNGPHVFPDGQMCLGNMTEVIPRLIGSYQLADAAEMLLAILQTVNVDDAAGNKVNRWPRSVKQLEIDKAAKAGGIKTDTTTTISARPAARPARRVELETDMDAIEEDLVRATVDAQETF